MSYILALLFVIQTPITYQYPAGDSANEEEPDAGTGGCVLHGGTVSSHTSHGHLSSRL